MTQISHNFSTWQNYSARNFVGEDVFIRYPLKKRTTIMHSTHPSFGRAVHRVIHGLIGLIFLLLAGTFLFAPLPSYAAVGLCFGIAVLFTGILEVLYALFFRPRLQGWGWHLAAGLVDLAVGVYLNAYPLISLTVIPMLAAFWLIWRGLTACAARQWILGVGAVVWGMVMLWWPAEGALTVVYFLAVAFAWMGIWRLILAFRPHIPPEKK
jgi:uncharacterized membrane protein HdeD (DUF308 family)